LVVKIKEYESTTQIAETLDTEISETKTALGQYLRRLDEIRNLAEKSKKIREMVMKLAGKKGTTENPDEITIGNMDIVLDANASHELMSIETAVRSHQERLLDLQKAREGLKPLSQLADTEGIKFLAVENNGVPERILFKLS